MKKVILTFAGTIALFVLVGIAGSLERSYDETECIIQEMDEDTYYGIMNHLEMTTGSRPSRRLLSTTLTARGSDYGKHL